MLSSPPHCHSAEEELFVVLDGDGTLLLGDDEHPVRTGSIVARPPGSGVAHAFRAGDSGLTLLAFGTRDPNDIVFYRAPARSRCVASERGSRSSTWATGTVSRAERRRTSTAASREGRLAVAAHVSGATSRLRGGPLV